MGVGTPGFITARLVEMQTEADGRQGCHRIADIGQCKLEHRFLLSWFSKQDIDSRHVPGKFEPAGNVA